MRSSSPKYSTTVRAEVELTGTIVHETDKAILFHESVSEVKAWIPLSQVSQIHREDAATRILCTKWIAETKGFIGTAH